MGGCLRSLRLSLVGLSLTLLAIFPGGQAWAGRLPSRPVDGTPYLPGGTPPAADVEAARERLCAFYQGLGLPPDDARLHVEKLDAAQAVEAAGRVGGALVGQGLSEALVIVFLLVGLLFVLDLLDEGVAIGNAGEKERLLAELGGNLPWVSPPPTR
ncbi:MAG: hypothetical protein AB1486_11465 [Planctomycetota bacterium]